MGSSVQHDEIKGWGLEDLLCQQTIVWQRTTMTWLHLTQAHRNSKENKLLDREK